MNPNVTTKRFDVQACVHFAKDLLVSVGMASEHAMSVAEVLVDADLLGHRTHGLAQLGPYVKRFQEGIIRSTGELVVEQDFGSAFTWRANRLPGAWVLQKAIAQSLERLTDHPAITLSIADCSHLGALLPYLEPLGKQGLLALLMTTSPSIATVAPHGAIDAVITSNPLAVCIPTQGEPLLIDQSTSVVSNSTLSQYRGDSLPGKWLLDENGDLSDDPKDVSKGTVLPLGGEDFGFKGFALGLMVEAFALALAGHARNAPSVRASQGVFLQIIDPARFAGREAFMAATSDLVARCKSSRVIPGKSVRLPGERALACKRDQLAHGLEIEDNLALELERLAKASNLGYALVSR